MSAKFEAQSMARLFDGGIRRFDIQPKVFSHATVGEAFVVKHKLGTRPSMVAALPFTDCRVWAEESDRNTWDTERVQLRCSVALAPLTLLIVE